MGGLILSKKRTVEPKGQTDKDVSDRGYKELFSNTAMFVQFLQTFVKEDWVKDIDEKDLERLDKEFIIQDNRKKESDIIYKIRFKDKKTNKQRDVLFYILFELQSTVDKTMSYRLLYYMLEIWRRILSNVKDSELNKSDFSLPAIVPMVLYNGKKEWTAPVNFKDLVGDSDKFGEYIVDFKYILVSVNKYSKEELYQIGNAISLIIRLDQTLDKKLKEEFQERLKEVMGRTNLLQEEHFEALANFTENLAIRKLDEGTGKLFKERMREIRKEGKDMTYAIDEVLDDIEKKGEMRGKVDVAKNALRKGADIEFVAEISELPIKKIREIQKEIQNEKK